MANAIMMLTRAESGFEAVEMAAHVAVSRHRRGAILGGNEGQELVAQSNRWMAEQGLRNPSRFCDMIAPGKLRAGKV